MGSITVSFAKEPYKRDDILQKRPVPSSDVCLTCHWLSCSFECLHLICGWVSSSHVWYKLIYWVSSSYMWHERIFGVSSSHMWLSVLIWCEIIGFFCKKALLKRRYSAKETSTFIWCVSHVSMTQLLIWVSSSLKWAIESLLIWVS